MLFLCMDTANNQDNPWHDMSEKPWHNTCAPRRPSHLIVHTNGEARERQRWKQMLCENVCKAMRMGKRGNESVKAQRVWEGKQWSCRTPGRRLILTACLQPNTEKGRRRRRAAWGLLILVSPVERDFFMWSHTIRPSEIIVNGISPFL